LSPTLDMDIRLDHTYNIIERVQEICTLACLISSGTNSLTEPDSVWLKNEENCIYNCHAKHYAARMLMMDSVQRHPHFQNQLVENTKRYDEERKLVNKINSLI